MSAPATLGLLVRTQVAELLGVNVITISQWEREGLPVAVRGAPGRPSKYNGADLVKWVIAREVARARGKGGAMDPLLERARRDRAAANLAEQTHAARAGGLLSVPVVLEAWGEITRVVRSRLLAMPQALAEKGAKVAVADGAAGLERLLRAEVHDALAAIASWQPPAEDPATAAARNGGRL